MRKYFIMIGGWCLALGLTAQERSIHHLQLPAADRGSKTYANIASVQVMSSLPDTSFIGVEPGESPNVRTSVMITEGVQNWLQAYVDGQLAPSFQPSGKKLIWVIHTLRVGKDSSAAGVVAFVKLGANAYVNGRDTNYQLLHGFDTAIFSGKGDLDIAATVVTALRSLCDRSAALVSKQHTGNAVTRAGLQQLIDSSGSYAILSARSYHRGLYLSFREFLNDAPSVVNFSARVDPASRAIKFYRLMPDSSLQAIPSVWGVSVHNELYRYQDGQLYAVEKNNNGFTLSKYLDYRKRKNQAMYWRNYIGEFQGDNNPYNDAHIYRTAVSKNSTVKAEATQLNMSTGNID